MCKIAVIPGDGIGVDVVGEGVKVLDRIAEIFGHDFQYENYLIGGSCIEAHGVPYLEEYTEKIRECDAILFGAVGGPKWNHLPREMRPETGGLGRLRQEFGLYANLRPSKLYPAIIEKSPLKPSVIRNGVDIMTIRDLTGGMYYGDKGVRRTENGLEAYDTEVYNEMEIRRIAHTAFQIALGRKKRVVSADKSNALESSKLWRKVVSEVSEEYPEVELSNMLVDKVAMDLAFDPGKYDVIVTTCMFGDILSDISGVITGSIGIS